MFTGVPDNYLHFLAPLMVRAACAVNESKRMLEEKGGGEGMGLTLPKAIRNMCGSVFLGQKISFCRFFESRVNNPEKEREA